MSSGKPVVRQIAWLSLIPQLVLFGLLIFIISLAVKPFETALVYALFVYLLIILIVRYAIPHNHRKGIALYKTGKYLQAIKEFEKSYNFFCRHSWIDKYRFITLLSSSRISYTEMALINMAFCYAQSGDAESSKQYWIVYTRLDRKDKVMLGF